MFPPSYFFIQMINNLSKEERKTHVIPSTLLSLFGFFPVGIFALKYALEAKRHYKMGNISDAKKATLKAKKLITIGLLITVVIYLLGAVGWVYLFLDSQEEAIQPIKTHITEVKE